jgi:hypothetical protein
MKKNYAILFCLLFPAAVFAYNYDIQIGCGYSITQQSFFYENKTKENDTLFNLNLYISNHDFFTPHFGIFANINIKPLAFGTVTIDKNKTNCVISDFTGFDLLAGPVFRFSDSAVTQVSIGIGLHAEYDLWKTYQNIEQYYGGDYYYGTEVCTYNNFIGGAGADVNIKFMALRRCSLNAGLTVIYDFIGNGTIEKKFISDDTIKFDNYSNLRVEPHVSFCLNMGE